MPVPRSPLLAPCAVALALSHLVAAPGYGYFRDELYYLACGAHLALGYVDHPPLVGVLAALVSHTLGHSLYALRLMPALAAGALFWLTGALAAALEGGTLAQLGAALVLALAPLLLALCSYFSMNAVELVLWALSFWLFLGLLRAPSTRGFALLGGVLGLALLNKLSTLSLGLGFALGLIGARRDLLRTRGPYIAAAIALACLAPHLAWQVAHDFPTLEFIRHARSEKMAPQTLGSLSFALLTMLGPLSAPVWLLGLGRLLRGSEARALGIACATVLLGVVLGDGKPYYVAPVMAPLFAAGMVAVARTRLRGVALGVLIAAGLVTLPLGKPVLPVATFLRYQDALGLAPQGVGERAPLGVLPQFYADMHGWPELARAVGEAHASLPPEARARACIFAENYGQAGAIDVLGAGLPPALSGHNSYFLWGPRGCTGETVIVIGGNRAALEAHFHRVTLARTHACALCMPYERAKPIWIAERVTVPMSALWPLLKHYI
ncbi:MAG: glycosyltransferase family 39 protein [Polyangiales bacterium]